MKLFERTPYMENGLVEIKKVGEIENGKSVKLGIFLMDVSQTRIGSAEIFNYEQSGSRASIICEVEKPYHSQGYDSIIYKLITRYLTTETDVRRVIAYVKSENVYVNREIQKSEYRLRRVEFLDDRGITANRYVYEKFKNDDYCKIGNGRKTMVILPGMALKSTLGSADLIEEHFKMFSDYTIYLMDDRKGVTEGYTLRNRAGDVAALMERLNLKDAYVYGASMGGMVAQYLAIDHPELVKKMFICATCPKADGIAQNVIGNWINLAKRDTAQQLVSETIKNIYSENTVSLYGQELQKGMYEIPDDQLEKFAILGKAVLGMDSLKELNKIKCPVMVIGSEGDKVLGPDSSRLLAKKLKYSELYMFGPEYGHGVYDEAPEVKTRMLDFFER